MANSFRLHGADFDDDGDDDLLVVDGFGAFHVLENSAGTFGQVYVSPNSGDVWRTEVFDCDGDNYPDVVQSAASAGTTVYRNDFAGAMTFGFVAWTASNAFASTYGMAIGDIDDDGDLDIVEASDASAPNITVYRNDGACTFAEETITGATLGDTATSVAIFDVDSDGKLDLVVGYASSPLEVWTNDGAGTAFTAHVTPIMDSCAVSWVGDIASDGLADLLCLGNGGGTNRYIQGAPGAPDNWLTSGFAQPNGNPITMSNSNAHLAVDFDSDGELEHVIGGSDLLEYFEHNLPGTYYAPTTIDATPAYYTGVTALDFDSDGDKDIVAMDFGSGFILYTDGMPPCTAELCNGLDDDCDGVVDNGPGAHADCGGGQECHWGTCWDTCSVTGECGGDICWLDDGRCGAADPCAGITCQGGESCYQGACFAGCMGDPDCSGAEKCWGGRCAVDPCDDVQCKDGDACYGGVCLPGCSVDGECSGAALCYAGRCTDDPCEGITCPLGDTCYQSACYPACDVTPTCSGADGCYLNSRCADSSCENVICGTEQFCHGGKCYDDSEYCYGDSECAGAPKCYDNRCETAACNGVQCPFGTDCYAGSCFTPCMNNGDCSGPDKCFEGRCTKKPCDDVECSSEQECYQGNCYQQCDETADCADPMTERCHKGSCIPRDCAVVTCNSGEVCIDGICFGQCMNDGDCDAPDGCFDGRCAPNACEAFATTEIANYNSGHIYRESGHKVRVYQRTTPWIYWRPFHVPGDDVEDFVGMSGNSSTAPVHQARKARAVLYLDTSSGPPPGKYAIYLTHGATSGQGAAEAVYGMRFWDVDPDVIMTDDIGAEGVKVTNSDPRHIQAFIKTSPDETGGVVVGDLPTNTTWELKLTGSLHGDLIAWELVNGETGEVTTLNPGEPVRIKNEVFATSADLTPKLGGVCDSGDEGICQPGTFLECKNGELVCHQTVFPAPSELCDGLDNTCNGLVDAADPSLRIPMIFEKQGSYSGYNVWTTYDRPETVLNTLNYTPSMADDRVGSTNVTLPDGTVIQDAVYKTHAVPYRDLRDGRIYFVYATGKAGELTGTYIDERYELDFNAPFGQDLDHMYVSWYDDRQPGPTNDRIIDDFTNAFDEIDLWWETVADRDGLTESDTAIVGVDWIGDPVGFNIAFHYETTGDEDDNPYSWQMHRPTLVPKVLDMDYRHRVRVLPLEANETVCESDTVTMMGCTLSRYQCVAGVLECQTAIDPACNTCFDLDGDGYFGYDPSICPAGTDCNDEDGDVYPSAPELCDGIDQDCDGAIDSQMVGCPNGTICGPAECNYAISCTCPDGPELPETPGRECVCGEGLAP